MTQPQSTTSSQTASVPHSRFHIEVLFRPEQGDALAKDVRWGLSQPQKQLSCKYLYDDTGSELFDRICDTKEYYPTRTEHGLLEAVAAQVLKAANPKEIVELGSGMARKTRTFFNAAEEAGRPLSYVPVDVSEGALTLSAEQLLKEYPWLSIRAIAADYEHQLGQLGDGTNRLFLFIGSTIGNFEHPAAVEFLSQVKAQMQPGDYLLLGTDLVKDHGVLNAAYNDSAGVTAAFNKNVLSVVNRELSANFDESQFEHRAAFNVDQSQIEMHLVARTSQRVELGALNWSVGFAEGETIRTEISRKFTRASVASTLAEAGLEQVEWYTPDNEYFGLSLARCSSEHD